MGLALGASTCIVFAIWLSFAIHSAESFDWIEFSAKGVLGAASEAITLAIGSKWTMPLVLALFAFGFFDADTRPHFIAFCTAFLLFALLPVMASFVKPIIVARYWQIGAPALLVLLIFATRTWLLKGFRFRSSKSLAAGFAAVFFFIASSVAGFANARLYTSLKPVWKGSEVLRPFLAGCENANVHVYSADLSRPHPLPSVMWSFSKLTGASPWLFKNAQLESTPYLAPATSPCAALGWAEHMYRQGWEGMSDSDLLKLLKIDASPAEVDIIRHRSGFVILKRHR